MGKIYQNAVGVDIRVGVGRDVNAATLLKFLVRKPSGVEVEWVASIYDDNTLVYKTIVGDLDEIGQYTLQAYAEWGVTSKHLGESATFRIYSKYNR